ncbi:hypothetical protein [Intestinibacter sp.]
MGYTDNKLTMEYSIKIAGVTHMQLHEKTVIEDTKIIVRQAILN